MKYDRQKYLEAVKSQLEPNIFKHSLALEDCMGGIYDYLQSLNQLGSDEPPKDDWLLAGLIHDIDFSGEFKQSHPTKTKEALAKYGLEISDTVHQIVKAHSPDLTGVKPTQKAHWAIFCADSLTGLIVAVALVYPTKKLAAGTRRDEVAMCSQPEGLNIPLEKFIDLCFTSMKKISSALGL